MLELHRRILAVSLDASYSCLGKMLMLLVSDAFCDMEPVERDERHVDRVSSAGISYNCCHQSFDGEHKDISMRVQKYKHNFKLNFKLRAHSYNK